MRIKLMREGGEGKNELAMPPNVTQKMPILQVVKSFAQTYTFTPIQNIIAINIQNNR